MMNRRRDFLPTDSYRFLDKELSIRSNSLEILKHFRLMYKRFYLGTREYTANSAKRKNKKQFMMYIFDNLDNSNELTIEDDFSIYCMSRTEDSYTYKYQDTYMQSGIYEGYSEPNLMMSFAMSRAISRILNNYNLIHAGAVSWNGDGIIFPASSNMGKTTLVLKLLSKGCRFLSDEIACMNAETNQLEPFPRAINVREESCRLLGLSMIHGSAATFQSPSDPVHTIDIEEIAENGLSRSSEPRYLIFLNGFGEKPGLGNISPSHALFNLIQFVLSRDREPSYLLLKLAPVVDRMQCFNLVMGDIDGTADLIMDLVSKTASAERTARHAS